MMDCPPGSSVVLLGLKLPEPLGEFLRVPRAARLVRMGAPK
jgi:hypothetical protein